MQAPIVLLGSPTVPVPCTFATCHVAWLLARRGKRPSANQLAFASRWLDALQHLHQHLRAGTWLPRRTDSFVVNHPKTREIHAPDFADRMVYHWLVAQPVQEWCADPAAAARVPPHKRLRNAPAGCGLPIGNLTSQFLQSRLRLRLKDEHHLAPLTQGVDFLGYVLLPTHRLVRRRVVAHCRAKLALWAARHVHWEHADQRCNIHAQTTDLSHLQHLLASYWGHFSHARSVRLRHALVRRFAWLQALFAINPAGDLTPRWVLQGHSYSSQVQWLHAECVVQRGWQWLRYPPLQTPDGQPRAGHSNRLAAPRYPTPRNDRVFIG